MKKILLAFSSRFVGEEVRQQLSGDFDVMLSLNGEETVLLLRNFQPEVFVLDLMLTGMDSAWILQAARDIDPCCRIMAAISYISDYVLSLTEQAKVNYLMKLPCSAVHLAGRIADLALWEPDLKCVQRSVRSTLNGLGFKINTESYRITELAVKLFAKNIQQSLTNTLYPSVANEIGGSVTQVEKAIRSCVESAWKNCDEAVWRLYFATGKNGKVMKPSNKEFLTRIAVCFHEDSESANDREERIVS